MIFWQVDLPVVLACYQKRYRMVGRIKRLIRATFDRVWGDQ